MTKSQFIIAFFTCISVLATASRAGAVQDARIRQDTNQPWPKLREVKWTEGSFWGERQRVCREQMLPAMTRLMEGTETSHFVENFRIAAGWKSGKHRGAAWNDGDTYKWLEALASVHASNPSSETQHAMDDAIKAIAAAQRTDGYLHTPVLIEAALDPSASRPLGDPTHFEMYNFGHLMTAACVHYESTGERTLLAVALRTAESLNEQFAKPSDELARHAICPAHYMGLIDLYRTTGDQKWLELAVRLLNMRDLVEGGDDNQDRIPFREQREAVGHAVRANYLYAGASDLMLETGDRSLWPALEACWSNVHTKKIYITGGCGALFDGASPDGSKKQTSITRIHQAYGRNYQLPNSTAHNETCAAIGNVLWNQRMWQAEHAARYIDALETSLINAVLAGVSLDGQRFFYTNTLRQLDTMPVDLRWSRERKEWISCYCCPPNVARTIANMHRLAYARDDQNVWVLLYGSNRLNTSLPNGSQLIIQQKSDYPRDGHVVLVLEEVPTQTFDLSLRVPGWCQDAFIERNGQRSSEAIQAGSFVKLKGPFKKGDRIVLDLGMPVRMMAAHPLVEECRGQVAVQRGPLVYCLESKDLPEHVNLIDVALSEHSPLKVIKELEQPHGQRERPSLAGMPVIEATFTISTQSARDSAAELYSTYQPARKQSFTAALIPYFAWGNRGPSEMEVWIPVVTDEPRP